MGRRWRALREKQKKRIESASAEGARDIVLALCVHGKEIQLVAIVIVVVQTCPWSE